MVFITNSSTTFSHSLSLSHFIAWSVFNTDFALASSLSMWSTYPLISVEFNSLGFDNIFHFPVFVFLVFISSCRMIFVSLLYIRLRSYVNTFFSILENLPPPSTFTSASSSSFPNNSSKDGNSFFMNFFFAFVLFIIFTSSFILASLFIFILEYTPITQSE